MRIALWQLGFRPFFAAAGIFAIVAIALWAPIFLGALPPPGTLDPILWHAHEMIYGYASAVIAGFVLTASQNWTGIRGVNGPKLVFIVLLWLAARAGMTAGHSPSVLLSALDLSFYPALAALLFPYLKPADMKIERVFFAYFALYLAGNLAIHLEALGIAPGYGLRGALLGLNVTITMIVFMGGRVIPFFTESELAKNQPRTREPVELLSHAFAWAFLLTQFLVPATLPAAVIAFAAGAAQLVRLLGWQVPRVRRVALLWVLHLSYLWIAAGYALFGFVSLGALPIGPAVHAFAIGGLGAMTYGMMARVSLGHTGRDLRPEGKTIAGFALVHLAAAIRVLGPVVAPSQPAGWVYGSAAAWLAAFAIFSGVYLPFLFRPRTDGRPG